MNCPKCRVALAPSHIARIEVDKCPKCSGIWLEYQELDQLEDTAFDVDEWKGTLVFRSEATTLPCPKCRAPMKRFDYRLFGLELEFCGQLHGYWLDKGEENVILELMRKTEADALHKLTAEARWAFFRKNINSSKFGNYLRHLMGFI